MDILLVDDAELFLDLEKSYLKRSAFNLSMARSGPEALVAIRSKRPTLVVLDLIMPGMDGDEVCRKIKSDPLTNTIPIIMVSSIDDPALKQRCDAAGCDAFVAKPIKKDDLLEAIEKTIDIARRRFPRIPTHLPSDAWYGGQYMELWIHSISRGGLFLQMDPAPPVGDEIDITFALPGVSEKIKAKAQIKYQGVAREGGPSGVGCQFIEIEGRLADIVGNYINDKLAAVGSMKGMK